MTGPNWGMHRSIDYRVLMAITTRLSLLAATSAVFVIVEHLVGVALIALGVGWLVVAALRRELRIRRRIADVAGTRSAVSPTGPGHSPAAAVCRTTAGRPAMDPAAQAAPRTGGNR